MLNRTCLITMAGFLLYVGCHNNGFPTEREINAQISEYETATGQNERAGIVRVLLESLSDPRSVANDSTVMSTLERLTGIYRDTHDEAILIALDSTRIRGGFANFVCDCYRSLYSESTFRARYRSNREALVRCIGVSFKVEDLDSI